MGVVVALSGQEATLNFSRSKMCAHCGACLSAGPQQMEMTLPNTLGAKIGDTVSVELGGRQVAGASMIAYLIPLALLLLGVWAGSRFSEIAAVCCGLGGWALSFVVLRVIDRRLKRRNSFQPVMREILSDPAAEIEN